MTPSESVKPAKVALLPPKISHGYLVDELAAAYDAVGELRGLLRAIPDTEILIAPFMKREAVASSAIEGTRATLADVLKYEAVEEDKDETKRIVQDIMEVRNYERAMRVALKELNIRPIGENLLKKTHFYLLDSVRGTNKDRGNFRKAQVMVGDYVPPIHTEIPSLFKNWEEYLNSKDTEKDPLIRMGVAHYQFEAIHPFFDGNGRIGRLIIPLFLYHQGVLQSPVLYISRYFEKHKVQYQDLLHKVDTDHDWIPWLKFFLRAVKEQAIETANLVRAVQSLYEGLKDELPSKLKSPNTISVLDTIFCHPIVSATQIREGIKAKSKATTYNLIRKFVDAGILVEVRSKSKEKIYIFSKLFNMIRK